MGRYKDTPAMAARRARVAEGQLQGKSYRQMAAELGVSDCTISNDVQFLRRQWARTLGTEEELRARAAMELDWLQGLIIGLIDKVRPEMTPVFFGLLIRVLDQRMRLFGLYPSGKPKPVDDQVAQPVTVKVVMHDKTKGGGPGEARTSIGGTVPHMGRCP